MIIDTMDFPALAAQCAPQIHSATLHRLIVHESAGNPYAIGVNGNYVLKRQPKSYAEAIQQVQWLSERGYDFDVGLGQINIRNAKKLGLNVQQLLAPCSNLRATAIILSECYERAYVRYPDEQIALRAALSCYNTGTFSKGFSNGYVQKFMRQDAALLPRSPSLTNPQGCDCLVPKVMRPVPKPNPSQTKSDPQHVTKKSSTPQTHLAQEE
jgi:type IV secretion system protein VirB1